jgi:hypothetical protein
VKEESNPFVKNRRGDLYNFEDSFNKYGEGCVVDLDK